MANVGVVGAGSWGTALALVLEKNGHQVTLWSSREAKAKEMAAETLTINVENVISGTARPSIIVYPQTTAGKAVLRIVKDGQTYKCDLAFAGGSLKAGTDYQYTITLNKTGAEVTKSEIHEWSLQTGKGDATMEE